MLAEGQTIIIRNCKIPVVNNHMRMQVDAFGKIEVSKEVKIDEVKQDKDFSAVTYDNVSLKGNKRFQDNNNEVSYYNQQNKNKGFSVNDASSINTYGSGWQ